MNEETVDVVEIVVRKPEKYLVMTSEEFEKWKLGEDCQFLVEQDTIPFVIWGSGVWYGRTQRMTQKEFEYKFSREELEKKL